MRNRFFRILNLLLFYFALQTLFIKFFFFRLGAASNQTLNSNLTSGMSRLNTFFYRIFADGSSNIEKMQ